MSYYTDKEKERSVYLRGLQAIGEDLQRQRQSVLRQPFAGNAPALTKPTRCRVLRPFFIGGVRQEVDTTVTLPKADADSLRAIGKVALL